MSTIITHKQFNNHIYRTEIAGRPFSLEFGKVAELANASAMVRYGGHLRPGRRHRLPRPRDGIDFFPCPWTLRRSCTPWAASPAPSSGEGQPSLPAVLASRVIDRSIRPLFPGTSATTWWSPAPS